VSEPRPPEGVRLVIGGQVIPCDVHRSPENDTDGSVAWTAVPRGPVTAMVFPGMGAEVEADLLPAHASLHVKLVFPPAQGLS
jgi:hypothetical protein